MLDSLKQEVLAANLELWRKGLVLYTFGNVSGCDREQGRVVIKPSGVPYERMTAEQMVVTDLEGKPVEGPLRPSSDLPTHLALYQAFPGVAGVAHTHSKFATSFAQARCEIPCLGTTHADYFNGPVPVTTRLGRREIEEEYERNTGLAIVLRFEGRDPLETPGVLVSGHGPFTWGASAAEAAHNAVILENLAEMAYYTLTLEPDTPPLAGALRARHFRRKHGPGAYYGQK